MENKESYSVLSNIKYVYKESFRVNKKMKFWLIFNFISSLSIPILSSVLVSIVVLLLTNGATISEYIIALVGMVLATIIFEVLKIYTFQRYTWENTFIRCNQFLVRLSRDTISCDYQRIEQKSGQKKLSNAFESLDSNWIGIEGMLKEAPQVLVNVIGMVVYLILVAINCPLVLIPMVLMVIIDFILTTRADKIIRKDRDANNESYYENAYLSKDIADPVNGKDIRIYRLEKWFDNLFVSLTKNRLKNESRYRFNSLICFSSHSVFDFLRDAIAYVTLISMIVNNTIDISTFTFMIGIVAGFSVWVNGTSECFYRLKSDSTQVCYYRDFLDESKKNKSNECATTTNLTRPLKVEFRNVSFVYPETDKLVIDDLSFIINPGEKIALVGNNGAGKTTIVKLMCGLYKPSKGNVFINDIDISTFKKEELMDLYSVVFQDSEPLAFTILEDICCCPLDKVDKDKFWNAVEKANFSDKVNSLPNKEETYITQTFDAKGIRLSGGENQKLMLARAIYKNASLLILDEPTAALDPINEEKMYLTYQSFASNNTSLFISHRLASTRFCDRIFFLENGKICEDGTHEELMNKDSKYRKIFDVQAQYYKEGENNAEKR